RSRFEGCFSASVRGRTKAPPLRWRVEPNVKTASLNGGCSVGCVVSKAGGREKSDVAKRSKRRSL
ncbi:MAG: hypothetical protein IJX36_03960, partial [Thermoguttaceae bacterium]|nr:hypothetical protein [Thermoguttaceae bacterium]